jgi:succinyl-CoA synthetase beta subunit
MNKKDTYWVKRDNLNKLDINQRSGSHLNCFRTNLTNTKAHEITKFLVFLELRARGYEVFTEAVFKEGRADIFIINIDGGMIIEIITTETREECIEKIKKYPCENYIIIKGNGKLDVSDLNDL